MEIAVEVVKRINSFDTLILFSGDSDFDYLLKECKKKGKKTVVVSLQMYYSKIGFKVKSL